MPGELIVKDDECKLAGEAGQVRAARRFIAELLGDDWPDVDEAILLTSELAANAVLHSASGRPGGKFTVRARVQPRDFLWVEVEDEGGPWTEIVGDGERGRGLDIVNAIADEWGKDGGPMTGWIVWARVDWSPGMSGADGASSGRPGPAPHPGTGTARQPLPLDVAEPEVSLDSIGDRQSKDLRRAGRFAWVMSIGRLVSWSGAGSHYCKRSKTRLPTGRLALRRRAPAAGPLRQARDAMTTPAT